MEFNGFSKKGIDFLKELEHNNTKVWFEKYKHIWEDEIRVPTEAFVEEMGETLQILVPSINYKPKVGVVCLRYIEMYALVKIRHL